MTVRAEDDRFWQSGQPITERDRDILAPLVAKYRELGRTPTKDEISDSARIKSRFRIWRDAVEAAGLPPLGCKEQVLMREAEAMNIRIDDLLAEVPIVDFIRDCVDIPHFHACCQRCENYERTWSCPPYDFSPMDVWLSYDVLWLYGKKIYTPDAWRERVYPDEELILRYNALLTPIRRKMLLNLLELEKRMPGSAALSGGRCDSCAKDVCARVNREPCREPQLMRYSIESLGGNVAKCAQLYLGETLLWAEQGRLPEYFILMGGLLKGKRNDQ